MLRDGRSGVLVLVPTESGLDIGPSTILKDLFEHFTEKRHVRFRGMNFLEIALEKANSLDLAD